jgi:hypothetical protein
MLLDDQLQFVQQRGFGLRNARRSGHRKHARSRWLLRVI